MTTTKKTRKTTAKKAPEMLPPIATGHETPHAAVSGLHLLIYKNCSPEHEFVLADGQKLRNLFELAEAFAQIDDGVFAHHVNHEKNDFANWVEHVFSEKTLAHALRASIQRDRHEIAVLKHLLGKLTHETHHKP